VVLMVDAVELVLEDVVLIVDAVELVLDEVLLDDVVVLIVE